MSPIGQHASGSAAYRPTSLDFINLPNPVEPHTQVQKHPLNGPPRLEQPRLENSKNQDLFKLILEPCNERPSKRQKASDNTLLDLPKLPVRNSAKRLRIPPTLSGLHQPPPDAGLLPSISVEQPQIPPPRHHDISIGYKSVPDRPVAVGQPSVPCEAVIFSVASEPVKGGANKLPRNKWTDEETADLLKGVAQFGIGSWTKILKCADYKFHRRTALDLKDRFRVCCPDHYASNRVSKNHALTQTVASARSRVEQTISHEVAGADPSHRKKIKGPASERVSSSQLRDLGIEEPFTKSGRRSRHGYSQAEDEAILRGFQKYGKSWSSIRKDATLNLSNRNPRDLRDRMRTKYPAEYAKAGLALPAEKTSTNKREVGTSSNVVVAENEEPKNNQQAPHAQEEPSNTDDVFPKTAKRSAHHSIFTLDDIFLDGLPNYPNHGVYVEETQPIVLDRGILDWAPRMNSSTNSNGIDPLMTLKLPKPVATAQQPINEDKDRAPRHLLQSKATTPSSSQNLPSLATLSLPSDQAGEGQLELPSLMHWYQSNMDEGGRNGILSLEELMC